MRTIFVTKEPNEEFAYTIGFSNDLAEGETISGAEVDDGEETGPESEFDDTTVTYQVTGGADGDTLTHNIRITTSGGNTFEANIIWEVIEQPKTFSLVAVSDMRSYLRLDHRDEDVMISDILREAEATFRQLIKRQIEAEEVTEEVKAQGKRRKLFLKNFPIDTEEDITVTDSNGEEINADDYTVFANKGYLLHDSIWGVSDYDDGFRLEGAAPSIYETSGEGYFSVLYTGGLSLDPNYQAQILPMIKRAIRIMAGDEYYQRNPRATAESLGDESVTLDGAAIPKQAAMIISFLKG